jgi:hypothetical protein
MIATFYIILAIFFTTLHFMWLGMVTVGSVAALTGWLYRQPRIEMLYLGCIFMAMINRLMGKTCLLTYAERYFLTLAHKGIFTSGFTETIVRRVGIDTEGIPLLIALTLFMAVGLSVTILWHSKSSFVFLNKQRGTLS